MEIRQITAESQLTCRDIVAILDRHIIGQAEAKRAVAIALRNRWRRMRLPEAVRREVVPNNIILIGPTGVGKTEIARRLAQIGGLPFLKVEATKFTEKGYVGRDVDSMVRDLVENAMNLVRSRKEVTVREVVDRAVEDRLIDLLFPPLAGDQPDPERRARWERSRDKVREQLHTGVLDDRQVTLRLQQSRVQIANIFTSAGMDIDPGFEESFKSMFPKQTVEKVLTVAQARKRLREEELSRRLDSDQLTQEALDLTEQGGIIFIDEIDKIAGKGGGSGPDVSREGVQRDLLPIVEGTTVSTKYGTVNTDHVLFIAAGAFHMSKPSDLIPELQGRFPVRVELSSLSEADFRKILRDTDNSLLKQYQAILDVDQCPLRF
ncbi:MAG: ATP-dependent protease ATPase subunit HslU, partial [Candidatus Krumholzibacteria bacterium]|nr:ATP-dependent protease ATPase subunit HslU [Candidatus Krumholzibacteria bacterium]